uniref:inositol-polyphosphate 5-phosphatase n=1 Tax=Timema cristinae TaxID=61476 RepID=A0A7R9GP46_TIMCR|nr:unnamed protein product [Timema cristinae]
MLPGVLLSVDFNTEDKGSKKQGTVTRLDPKFIALHCQEVGGKNYERSMKHVEFFVKLLMSSEELRLFDKVRVYLDEDYSSAENFTALGSLYFIHESITDVLIWDFSDLVFVPATGKEVFSGNIEAISTKEKSKFPQDFFPECKWSRKGFLRTRWSLHGTVLDLINIHLFHDASNFIAMESVSLTSSQRLFHSDENGTAPFFLFGDFNFRTDSQGVIQKLCEGLQPIRLQSNKTDHTKLQYQDEASQVIFSLGRKEFSHHDHQTLFIENEASWLKAFDRELEPFEGRLYEFPISFPPSYPFEEEEEKGPRSYMQTRCPSWCDRVVLSSSAKSLVNNISEPGSVEYGLVGPNTCMGDHKPVYLRLLLAVGAGRVKCCTSLHQNAWPCTRSMSLQTDHLFVPDAHQPLYASLSVDVNYLPLPCTTHEPYTPESVDTPSPAPSSPLHVESLQDKLKLFVEQQSGDMTAVSSSDVVDSNLKLDNDDQINPLLLECSMRKAEDETATPLSQDDKPHYDILLLESVKDESEKASKLLLRLKH